MMWLSYEASSCSVVCKAEGKLLMHLSCCIRLFISWTCFSWYKSVLYFRKPLPQDCAPLGPRACCFPPSPFDLTCFTLCEVLYFQLYKAISSLLSTVLGYTCNMMHFSFSLLNAFWRSECSIWYWPMTHLTVRQFAHKPPHVQHTMSILSHITQHLDLSANNML